MRCSPKRIALATLAFVVSAVLALPMLLVRKAEAGAPPKLEASSETGWMRAADDREPGRESPVRDADSHETGCSGPLAPSCSSTLLVETGPTGVSVPVLSSAPPALPVQQFDRLAYASAETGEAPWPDPHSIDRQRRYHLRP